MANGQPSLVLADKARNLPLSEKTGLAICHFASALKSAKPVANAPHSPEIKASYCEKSKPTTVKISITLVTGGGLKTGIGASAPVLPLPSFSTRQVFILTDYSK